MRDIYLDVNIQLGIQRGKLIIGDPYRECMRRSYQGVISDRGRYGRDYEVAKLNKVRI